MNVRYGAHGLADGARSGAGAAGDEGAESVDTSGDEMAGFAARSVDTGGEIAGFARASPGRPRPRTGIPAAFR